MQSKSKNAFSHNVGAEMDSGKDRAQSLAIAYSIKKKNAKKMAHGGMVENEKLHPEHEPMHDDMMDIVHSIMMKKDPSYAEGGMVEMPDEQPGHEMEMMSKSGDDFLSDEAQTPLAMDHMPDDPEHEQDGEEDYSAKKRRIMAGIMDEMHSRLYGM